MNESSLQEKSQRTFNHNIRRFYYSLLKFLKLSVRDVPTYFWVIGYPMVFILIFGVAFNSSGTRASYSIAIINEDISYDPQFDSDYATISTNFIELFNPETGNKNLSESFILQDKTSDGEIYNRMSAIEALENDEIDGVIIIPSNFSEIIIGTTWWYPMFAMLPEQNQTQLAETIGMTPEDLLSSNFTTNSHPSFEIHVPPDSIAQTVLLGVMEGILNDIILSYNDVKTLNVEINQVNQVSFTYFDTAAPGFVIVGVLVSIMMVAMRFAKEKDEGLLERLDTTPVPRSIHLLSGGLTQVIYSSIQIIILLLTLQLFGIQTAPDVKWGLAFLTALAVVLPCIGIGLILAALVKNEDEAGGAAWLVIIPVQFLSNAFFPLNPDSIIRYNPIYHGVVAMQRVMLFGVGISEIGLELLFNLGAGVVLILLGIIIFEKKTRI